MKNKIELSELWHVIDEVISNGGEFTISPNGISMLPLLRPGIDSVVLISPNDIKKGDIVLYKRDNGKFVLHRVMAIKKDEYIMCGDNQKKFEYGITSTHLLAKVKDMYRGEEKIDTESKEYQKYLKKQYKKIKWQRIRRFLANIKHKIFK